MKRAVGNLVHGHGRDQVLGWNTHLHRCPWCRRSRGVTYVEFYSARFDSASRRGYLIRYPSGDVIIGIVSHDACGPDSGYAIRIDDLVRQGTLKWTQHVSDKLWWPSYGEDILLDVLALHRRDRSFQENRDGSAAERKEVTPCPRS